VLRLGQPAEAVLTSGYRPARVWQEAPRAKRALRKIFGISRPSCLNPCCLLDLTATERAAREYQLAIKKKGVLFASKEAGSGARFVARTAAWLPGPLVGSR
jgi:hypothetical protein